jgi:hypothetical protein
LCKSCAEICKAVLLIILEGHRRTLQQQLPRGTSSKDQPNIALTLKQIQVSLVVSYPLYLY